MRASRVAAVALRYFYLVRGSPVRLLPMIAWVAIDIVLWGFITRYLDRLTRFDFVSTLLGAVLLWDFLGRVMQGITTAFFEDVWSRNFLNVFATPLTIADYLSGLVITGIVTSLLGLAAMLLLATGVFGLSFFAYGLALVPFVFVLFVTGIALGVVGTSIVLRFGPASEWLIWPIPSLLSPFVGVFYPLATLPAWMRPISHLLAPSYVFEGMRAIMAGKPIPWDQLGLGSGLAVLYLVGACLLFSGVHRYALRAGLIARYSAETAS
jgi:ABC-2 type transport system permease protein